MTLVRLKPPQWTVFGCDQRFRVLVAGRRFGKTFLALVWYVAPTYKQAKRIAWKPLKQMTQALLEVDAQRNRSED